MLLLTASRHTARVKTPLFPVMSFNGGGARQERAAADREVQHFAMV